MDERLQAYLDGEISLAELPPELRERAGEWDRLVNRLRAAGPAGAPLGLERRILEAVTPPRRRPGWLDWLLRPRQVRISPLAAVAAAALVLAVAVRPWSGGGPVGGDAEVAGHVYVQFTVEAPGAASVHLAGDFSDWQPGVALADPDGDGVWTGRAALEPGVHEYMFVLDGTEWMPDPNASTFTDDGFGQRNSVVAVAPLNGT
ncbi:MAG: glycogen-binding domain-containing protein [Gemmatimonadota bacterium]|nr:glycogen-binding domain-containing protein [Gemmatimonadota bacterium]